MQQKYLPLLKDAANAEEIRWSSVALLVDRVLLGKGEKKSMAAKSIPIKKLVSSSLVRLKIHIKSIA